MDPFQDLDELFSEFGFEVEGQDERLKTDVELEGGEDAVEDWGEDEEEREEETREEDVRRWTERENEAGGEETGGSGDSEGEGGDEFAVQAVHCTCKADCMGAFDADDLEEHRLTLREMEKSEREMFVMASLQKYTNEDTRRGKRRRTRYRLMYGGRQVCKAVFCFANDIGKNYSCSYKAREHERGCSPNPWERRQKTTPRLKI